MDTIACFLCLPVVLNLGQEQLKHKVALEKNLALNTKRI